MSRPERGRGDNPMDTTPPYCRCGEARAARQDVKDNPHNPMCHLCRVVAVDHPDYSDDEVAAAGAAWWRRISPAPARAA